MFATHEVLESLRKDAKEIAKYYEQIESIKLTRLLPYYQFLVS